VRRPAPPMRRIVDACPVDVDSTLERVTAHRDAEEFEEARVLLRALAEQAPRDLVVRMALADFARAEGHVDQAARWGIVIDGYTTAHERRVFWRVLTGITTVDRLRTYLRLRPGSDLPRDLTAILPPHLGGTHVDGSYRKRWDDDGWQLSGPVDEMLLPLWTTSVLPGVAAVLWRGRLDAPSTLTAVVSTIVVVASIVALVAWIVHGVRSRTIVFPSIASLLLVAGLVFAVGAVSGWDGRPA